MPHSSSRPAPHGLTRLLKGAATVALALAATFALPAQGGSAATSTAASSAPAARCCSVTINGPAVTMTVSRPGATASKTFRAAVGDQLSEVLTNVVTSDNGCAFLTLLNPSGGTVDSSSGCSGTPAGVGPDTATVPGVYTVKMTLDAGATGHAKLWVSVPAGVGVAPENKPAPAMNVTRVGQGVERTFTGSIGQRLDVAVTNVVTSDNGCAFLTLLNPSGGTVDASSACSGTPAGVGPDTLTVAGTYTVLLRFDTVATGTSKLWVSVPVSLGTITVNGTAKPVNVTRVGQGIERTFHGSTGERITSMVGNVVTSDNGCVFLTILTKAGDTVDSSSACSGTPVTVGPDRLSAAGTYTALYQADSIATGTGKLKITS